MNPARAAEDAAAKKRRLEGMFVAPMGGMQRTPEEMKDAFEAAVKTHPFVDLADHMVEVTGDGVFFDGAGNVVGVLLRQAIPEHARKLSADVLRAAATRTSLRANIFGGEAPLSGIAGYYDYSGSPIEYKCRKTSFTCEVLKAWPDVFPLVDYVSAIYRASCPNEWQAQSSAIPDMVRIHNSPFSTLTINQRFRTASHTDAGDFDAGYGLLSILEGDYDGLHLGLSAFRVCFHMKPRDLLIFNTHHFHANTELERFGSNVEWNRLTCVFYYRAVLGEPTCMQHYKRRLEVAKGLPVSERLTKLPDRIVDKDNGDNHNRPSPVIPVTLTPMCVAALLLRQDARAGRLAARVHRLCTGIKEDMSQKAGSKKKREATDEPPCGQLSDLAVALAVGLFGEETFVPVGDGLPQRTEAEKISVNLQVTIAKGSALGGFSEARGAIDVANKNHTLLDDTTLADALGPEAPLLAMWREARTLWLSLVKRDWEHAVSHNPARDDFSWKNKSDMNTAFFDLCEVAKQVMVQLLGKENPTKVEENAFWLCFAGHLYHACASEIGMVKDAMSMKKLNVKLKDFHFGGTRYFKDMPKEEQERRLARKKRIEEARKLGANQPEPDVDLNWLENDNYDYQSEDSVVQYRSKKWVTPADNAANVKVATEVVKSLLAADVSSDSECISILVIVPPSGASASEAVSATPSAAAEADTKSTSMKDTMLAMEAGLSDLQKEEVRRLLGNDAAKRSFCATLPAAAATIEVVDGVWQAVAEKVSVRFVAASEIIEANDSSSFAPHDFVVLRHCLTFYKDDDAAKLLQCARSLTRCRLFVTDCVASCRSSYVLTPERLAAFDAIAPSALRTLLLPWVAALPCSVPGSPRSDDVTLRSKSALSTLIETSAGSSFNGMFHFHGSPRNTTCWVV